MDGVKCKECHSLKGQMWYIIHLNSVTIEAVKKFVPPIHFVYVPEIENIVEPEDVGMARKID